MVSGFIWQNFDLILSLLNSRWSPYQSQFTISQSANIQSIEIQDTTFQKQSLNETF